MGEDERYTSAHLTGGRNLSLMFLLFYFSKACMAQNRPRLWHIRISEWMEQNSNPAVNSEKTIFMKRQGSDFIMHGLFVDEKMYDIACPYL